MPAAKFASLDNHFAQTCRSRRPDRLGANFAVGFHAIAQLRAHPSKLLHHSNRRVLATRPRWLFCGHVLRHCASVASPFASKSGT